MPRFGELTLPSPKGSGKAASTTYVKLSEADPAVIWEVLAYSASPASAREHRLRAPHAPTDLVQAKRAPLINSWSEQWYKDHIWVPLFNAGIFKWRPQLRMGASHTCTDNTLISLCL